MASPLAKKLAKALGSPITSSRPMRGGDIADVSCLTLADGRKVVAKRPRADQPDTTAVEAMMLAHLKEASSLPVPEVLFQETGILVISHIEHQGATDAKAAAESVAEHAAALHQVTSGEKKPYGFKKDTVIGPLPQKNAASANWVDFFTANRLLIMAQSCLNTSKIDTAFMGRIEALAKKLPDIIPAKPAPSLLHGDLWAGNILIDGDHAAGFIDPAISYGHREMDLAFIQLMGGLDPAFLDAYSAAYSIDPGFLEERCAVYQLWPLLVHTRLFGGGYAHQVASILDRFGV